MGLVTSRRSLILGIPSLVVAPSLVRAMSLMDLRGEIMDPRVVAYYGGGNDIWYMSMVNDILNVPRNPERALRVIKERFSSNKYELKRASEIKDRVSLGVLNQGVLNRIDHYAIMEIDRRLV